MRYLGNNYTGNHRNIRSILKTVQPLISTDDYASIKRILIYGTPSRLNHYETQKNYKSYLNYGNHPSFNKYPERTAKILNKEDKHNYTIFLPEWIKYFIPNAHFTPQGLVVQPGKNDRLVYDGTFRVQPDSIAINDLVTKHTEPEITFATEWQAHLKRIYNLRITYPDQDILLMDDDVAGCFRQPKHAPDIISAMAFAGNGLVGFPCGQTFGSRFSPSNWEPFRRARQLLMTSIFHNTDILHKHEELVETVKYSDPPSPDTQFIQAIQDSINKGVLDSKGQPVPTESHTHVDDSMMADIRERVPRALKASIESLYLVLGEPNTKIRRDEISREKYEELVVHYKRTQCGRTIDTRKMVVTLPDTKRTKIIKQLRPYHPGRKSGTVLEQARLLGILNDAAIICPWAKFLYQSLYDQLKKSLAHNGKRLKRKILHKHFEYLINHEDTTWINHKLQKYHFLTGSDPTTAKLLWQSKTAYYYDTTSRRIINALIDILTTNTPRWEIPIGFLIDRDPTFTQIGDACIYGGGGFSYDLNFKFHHKWPEHIHKKTIKFKQSKTDHIIDINNLEYAILIIGYAGSCLALRHMQHPPPHPVLLQQVDNKSTESWTNTASTGSPTAKLLSIILARLMMHNPNLGTNAQYIQGEKNESDAISRIYQYEDSHDRLLTLYQENPQLASCRLYRPSAELLSEIHSALSMGKINSLKNPIMLGQLISEPNSI